MDYKPIFQVTSSIIKNLGKIEAVKEIVETLVIPIALEESFRKEASAKATHYSTKIEGNRLTLKQTKELLMGKDIVAREIDKREVMNYGIDLGKDDHDHLITPEERFRVAMMRQ